MSTQTITIAGAATAVGAGIERLSTANGRTKYAYKPNEQSTQ